MFDIALGAPLALLDLASGISIDSSSIMESGARDSPVDSQA